MSLTLITAPAIEPLTLADAKAHARVSVTDDDALITAFIQAARERCENMLGRALITQTWEKVLDQFPTAIQLSWPPIQSIVSVKYIDANGAQQTLAPANYVLDNAAEPGWLVPAINATWPDTQDVINAVRVQYKTGYGDTAASIPESIKAWLKVTISTLYENREHLIVGQSPAVLPGRHIDGLLDRYTILQLF